jgi:hypothetical protein
MTWAFSNAFFLIATALVLISSHTHRQTRICAHSALSNSQMCISVIETKRSPIHGLVPLHPCIVAMTKFRPDCLQIISPEIPWTGVDLGFRDIYARKRPRSWVIGVSLGGSGVVIRCQSSLTLSTPTEQPKLLASGCSGCSGSPAAKISKPAAQKAHQQQARSTNASTKHQAEQKHVLGPRGY